MAARTKSKVTPGYKTKYRVKNWTDRPFAPHGVGQVSSVSGSRRPCDDAGSHLDRVVAHHAVPQRPRYPRQQNFR